MKNYQKGSVAIVVSVIIGLLIVGGGGYYVGTKITQAPESKIPTTTAQETPDQTSDWKIYRNDKYGFEFKYPPTWNLTENSDPTFVIPIVKIEKDNIVIKFCVDCGGYDGDGLIKSEILVNGVRASKVERVNSMIDITLFADIDISTMIARNVRLSNLNNKNQIDPNVIAEFNIVLSTFKNKNAR